MVAAIWVVARPAWLAAGRIANLPIWAFHADADKTVPVVRSRHRSEAIRRLGGKPRYTEYLGKVHTIMAEAYAEPELLPWLFAERRNP